MIKRKVKRSSLYGVVVSEAGKPLKETIALMSKPITNAMRECAKHVRHVGCPRCLHYEKCTRDGVPVSNLGVFLAWLNLVALKPIAADIRKYCVKGLKLEAHAATDTEELKGFYATIRAFNESKPAKLLFRVGLHGDESTQDLYTIVFNAYVKSRGKGEGKKKGKVRKNGKITKA